MWVVSVIAALIIICYVWSRWADKHRAYWGFFVPVKMSALEAECALVHLLGHPDQREIDNLGDVVLTYLRGDREVTEARTVTPDMWTTWMPTEFVATVGRVENITFVGLHAYVPKGVSLSLRVIKSFCTHAESELKSLGTRLQSIDASLQQEKAAGPHATKPTGFTASPSNVCDFGLLGLKPGAAWAEVQSAFRTISMQFHPDRMVGLPENIIELGTRRFNEASGAYQRLREQLGSQA